MPDAITRRQALQVAAAGTVLAGNASGQDTPARPGLTVRQSTPPNLEAPFSDQKSFLTPNEQFFVRSHFASPSIDPESYRLKIDGAVAKPLELSLNELKAMGSVKRPITLECAGNGRVFLAPAVRGLQWQQGGISTAEWVGIPIATILEKAGVKPSAKEVVLIGTDKGAITSDPASPGPVSYDRSIPIEKVKRPESMVVWEMNGEPLPIAHGAPLRAVIGGWYGMASVKWLSRIFVSDTPYQSFWQTFDYSYFERRNGGMPSLTPVSAMQPKSQIARPTFGERVPPSSDYLVHGWAWAGEQTIASVEVSTDAGKTWSAAKLVGEEKPFCWRAWEFAWKVPNTPNHAVKLLCRCVDRAGKGQPEQRDSDRRSYMINHLVPVEVTIR